MIRRFKQMEDLGHRMLKADNAHSAIEILKRELHIDLLFTDVVLPGGVRAGRRTADGRHLAAQAYRKHGVGAAPAPIAVA